MRRFSSGLVAIIALSLTAGAALPAGGAPREPGSGELWVARYNGPSSGVDDAKSIAMSPDGSKVFVTGISHGSNNDDYATVAYDAGTGAALWGQRYNGQGNGTDQALSVTVSPDGSKVFVTGNSSGSATGYDYVTLAYDATTGNPLWIGRYNGLGNSNDYAVSITPSPDGSKAFVTGHSDGGAIDYDYATVAYDATTGAALWARRFNGSDNNADYGQVVAVSPDSSRVFVTGYGDMGSMGNDYVTIAYDAVTGSPLWLKDYDGPGHSSDYAYALAVSPDGSKVFVTGQSQGASTGYDYATIAIDAESGASVWLRRFNGPGNGSDYGQGLAVSPDGTRLFVTGYADWDASDYDYTTLAYDAATGAQVWGQRFDGSSHVSDYAFSVGVTPDGLMVFVSGYASFGGSGTDYATAAYAAGNGAFLGVRRYNGPGNGTDYARALAISPDGSKVFVTGESKGVTTNYDYATTAYPT
jgi:WD40 repeat protein